MKIIRNAVKCLTCDTVIESRHRHDFVVCNCERLGDPDRETYVFVDGGYDYFRMGAGTAAKFEALHECE